MGTRHLFLPVALALVLGLAACVDDVDEAGDETMTADSFADDDDLADEIGEGIEETGEAIGEGVQEAGDKIEDAADEIGEEVEEAVEDEGDPD